MMKVAPVIEVGNERRLVPMMFHRLGVVTQNSRPAAKFEPGPVKLPTVSTRGPRRAWRDRGQDGIPAGQLAGLEVRPLGSVAARWSPDDRR
jgi:hypothetical protein